MTIISRNIRTGFGAEEALIQGKQLSQTPIRASSDIIIFINAEEIVTYVSPSIIPCTGYTPAEIIDRRLSAFVHPDDADILQEILVKVGQIPGKGLRAEYRLQCKNGAWCWCE